MWLREMAGGVLPQPEAVEELHSSSIRLTDGDLVEVFAPPYPGPGRRSMGKFDQLNVSSKKLTWCLTAAAKTAGQWQIVAVIPSEMRAEQSVPSTFGSVPDDEREERATRELPDVVASPSNPLSSARPFSERSTEEMLEIGRRLWRPSAAERTVPRQRMRRNELGRPVEESDEDLNADSDDEDVNVIDEDDDEQEQLRWAIADSLRYARGEGDNPAATASLNSSELGLRWNPQPSRQRSSTQRIGHLPSSQDLLPVFPSRTKRVFSSFQEVHEMMAAKKRKEEEKAKKQIKTAKKTDIVFVAGKREADTDEETDDETESESSQEERKRKHQKRQQMKRQKLEKDKSKTAARDEITEDPLLGAARPATRPPPKLYMSQSELRRTSLADIEKKQKGKSDTAFEHGSSDPLIKYSRIINRTDGGDNPLSPHLSLQSLDKDVVYPDEPVDWKGRADQNRRPFEVLKDPKGTAVTESSAHRSSSTRPNKQNPDLLEPATLTTPPPREIHGTGYNEYNDDELSFKVVQPSKMHSPRPGTREASTYQAARRVPPPPLPRRHIFSTRSRTVSSIVHSSPVIPISAVTIPSSSSGLQAHQIAPEAPMFPTIQHSDQGSSPIPSTSTVQRNTFPLQVTASGGNSMRQTSIQPEAQDAALSAAEDNQREVETPAPTRGRQPDWLNSPWMPKDDSDDE